jgi:hypothetical protein
MHRQRDALYLFIHLILYRNYCRVKSSQLECVNRDIKIKVHLTENLIRDV